MRVENMTSTRGTKVANQFVLTGYEKGKKIVTFQSYESHICDIVYNCGMGFEVLIRFGHDWGYSRTTSKYLYQFLSEFGFVELNNKKAIEDAIERGTLRSNKSIAIMYDKTMR